MLIIGVTGSSGSGKSSVCKVISKIDKAEIIDADKVVKELQDSKSEYYEKIVETFGKDILLDNELIDRKKLAEIIFSNYEQKQKLDKLTIKYVVEEIKRQIESLKYKDLNYIIVDAPILFEANMNEMFDKIIVVLAKEENKLKRICQRDGISKELASKRIKAQKTDEFYRENADFVIENDDEDIENKVKAILGKIGR